MGARPIVFQSGKIPHVQLDSKSQPCADGADGIPMSTTHVFSRQCVCRAPRRMSVVTTGKPVSGC